MLQNGWYVEYLADTGKVTPVCYFPTWGLAYKSAIDIAYERDGGPTYIRLFICRYNEVEEIK